ncbi:MAG: metal ABC transporter solute-binding protein, Zn/Mn family [Saccharofermentanales bacterium]|jgi:manganese/zinc/iron transport system substrate-binding protein
MKRWWMLLLIFGMTLSLVACAPEPSDDRLHVTVTTSFLDDMVRNIAPMEVIDLKLVIPAGSDPHTYLPKPQDFNKLARADVVLYHGLHFEGKMVDALEPIGIAVTDAMPIERLQLMDEDGRVVYDPHFWFDLELYAMAVDRASEVLARELPAYASEIYTKAAVYKDELAALDRWIRAEIASIPEATRYLITPHDAFQYFSKAYDIPVFSPQGLSTEAEVATRDIMETVHFIVTHGVRAIFVESTTDPARMEKIREAAVAKGVDVNVVHGEDEALFSDSLAEAGHSGDTFLDMYRHNVDVIVRHLR